MSTIERRALRPRGCKVARSFVKIIFDFRRTGPISWGWRIRVFFDGEYPILQANPLWGLQIHVFFDRHYPVLQADEPAAHPGCCEPTLFLTGNIWGLRIHVFLTGNIRFRRRMVHTSWGISTSCRTSLFARFDTLHHTPYTLHHTPYTHHGTPSTLHPQPYTLNPEPSTLNPEPSTLNPKPYTLYPSPYTVKPTA